MESGGVFTYLDGFLPGGIMNNQAVGINNAGIVVGFYQDASANSMGISLTAPQRRHSISRVAWVPRHSAINNLGEIVGDYTDSSGDDAGFMYIGGIFTRSMIQQECRVPQ